MLIHSNSNQEKSRTIFDVFILLRGKIELERKRSVQYQTRKLHGANRPLLPSEAAAINFPTIASLSGRGKGRGW
jgi:hypothetical protein